MSKTETLQRDELVDHLNTYLSIREFTDYCPNGLQIKGRDTIKKIAFAVSATKYSVTKAVELGVDTLIVHHGLFWKFHGPKTITGAFYNRVAPLIKNDINLLGFHLPLDAHMEVGNARAIADLLELSEISEFGEYKKMPLGVQGKFKSPMLPKELKSKLKEILNHDIIHSAPDERPIKSIGIITGGANSQWRDCLNEGIDAYLTGEISEHDWHESQEDNIHFFAGGHNATEQFGVQSLMKHLHNKYKDLDLEYYFIPSENPA